MSNKEQSNIIIGKNIERLLRERNMTQSELASRLGLSESAVGKWVLGRNGPTMGRIQKMSEIFKVPYADILSEKSEANSKKQFLMDKIDAYDDKQINKVLKLMELIDDEENRNW